LRDAIAEGLEINGYEAAEVAAAIRSSLVSQGKSFIFETVLSDPVGDKVDDKQEMKVIMSGFRRFYFDDGKSRKQAEGGRA
jgi:hypothetical protein